MKLLYRLFYKGFLKYHETRRETKEGLVYSFTDMEGRKYYTWPEKGQIPKCRYDRLMDLTIYWEARLAPKTIDEIGEGIIEAMEKALAERDSKDRSKAASAVIAFANELMMRRKNGMPMVIANEMAAFWAIREDEDPNIINEQIHDEKVEMFATETAAGRDFFLTIPQLAQHLNLWRVSRSELRKLYAASEVEARQKSEIVGHLLSVLRSGSTTEDKDEL